MMFGNVAEDVARSMHDVRDCSMIRKWLLFWLRRAPRRSTI